MENLDDWNGNTWKGRDDFCWDFGMYSGNYLYVWYSLYDIYIYIDTHYVIYVHITYTFDTHYVIYIYIYKNIWYSRIIYIRIQYFEMLMFVCCNCRRFDIAKDCTTLRNTWIRIVFWKTCMDWDVFMSKYLYHHFVLPGIWMTNETYPKAIKIRFIPPKLYETVKQWEFFCV